MIVNSCRRGAVLVLLVIAWTPGLAHAQPWPSACADSVDSCVPTAAPAPRRVLGWTFGSFGLPALSWSSGQGGEFISARGIGLGGALLNGPSRRVAVELDGSFHLFGANRSRPMQPFVIGGGSIAMGACRAVTCRIRAATLGVGTDWWVSRHIGVRVELLDRPGRGSNGRSMRETRFGFAAR